MAHAEELCQHIVMIHQGRKVLDEPMAGLRRKFDAARHPRRTARRSRSRWVCCVRFPALPT
jgi:ABC-type uncharacterized transport system ATPase subunit